MNKSENCENWHRSNRGTHLQGCGQIFDFNSASPACRLSIDRFLPAKERESGEEERRASRSFQ